MTNEGKGCIKLDKQSGAELGQAQFQLVIFIINIINIGTLDFFSRVSGEGVWGWVFEVLGVL